jgi:hypothetical protein
LIALPDFSCTLIGWERFQRSGAAEMLPGGANHRGDATSCAAAVSGALDYFSLRIHFSLTTVDSHYQAVSVVATTRSACQ